MTIKLALSSLAAGCGVVAAIALFTELVPRAWADVAGTRLKPRYTLGADGSKLFDPEILHDSQLGVDCKFALAADDKLRCLPAGSDAIMSEVDYTDSKCTVPMVLLGWGIPTPPTGCTLVLPKYVYQQEAQDRCSTDFINHFFPVEGTIKTADRYVKSSSGCALATTGETVVMLNPESAATSFAAGTATTDP